MGGEELVCREGAPPWMVAAAFLCGYRGGLEPPYSLQGRWQVWG